MSVLSSEFCLTPDFWKNLAAAQADSYVAAQPFPHIVIDNFLPQHIADAILQEFDDVLAGDSWHKYVHENSKKLAITKENELGPLTRHVIAQLNNSDAVTFLEKLTGISGLIPDPHLWGGGLHRIDKGGFLDVHADFNWHERLRLDRRLNLLLYLNKDWEEAYGGALELWDANMVGCEKKVLPLFNRCVIFNTTDFSYHGHPIPLTCPEDRARKSLALYYYSNGRPSGEVFRDHSKETLYYETGDQRRHATLKVWLRKIMPPVLFTAIGTIRRAIKKI